jgi:putative ABC transport system substrate-binding protein
MTERRAFVAGALSLLAAPLAAAAQPAERVYRLGILGDFPPPRTSPSTAAYYENLRAGLREHGYVEGRNLALEFRWTEGKPGRVPALAAELVGLPVDVVVAGSTRSALAYRTASARVPVVFVGLVDPVGSGLVSSLARPGGNVTGVSWDVTPETSAKLLELLKEAVPAVSRVAALWQPGFPAVASRLQETQRAAGVLGVTLQPVAMPNPDDYTDAFTAVTRGRAGGLVVLPSFIGWNRPRPLLDFAAERRLPAAYYTRELVDQGGLMSYGPSFPDVTRRAAAYVARILKGAKPADLPVEQPTKFELIVNMKTARALGLTVPPSVLARADEVIE